MPVARPWVEHREVLRTQRPRTAEQHGISSEVKRANHPGDVAQRRALEPAHREWTADLALEVEDHEVASRVENLGEMIIAVAANDHRLYLARFQRLKGLAHVGFEIGNLL